MKISEVVVEVTKITPFEPREGYDPREGIRGKTVPDVVRRAAMSVSWVADVGVFEVGKKYLLRDVHLNNRISGNGDDVAFYPTIDFTGVSVVQVRGS